MLDGASILITGGTGSFGHRFVKTVLDRYAPRRLIVFSRDEMKQYEMEQRFPESDHPSMRYFIGDVRNGDRLEMAMRDVDYVIHAAALKHVTAAEYNPFECVQTNIHGAENVVNAAIRNDVKGVIALSTDKAANPVNLYGASKLASDKIFVAGNHLSGRSKTRFSVVRYGNVLGSRGSVIPYFNKLLAENTPHLPITDKRMTRFWITLQQGVDFVLSSMDMMQGGEVYVPKIPSMRIVDLAACMAPNLPIKEIGIRPGEKLHEVMITEDDSRTTLELADRYIIEPSFNWWSTSRTPIENGVLVPDGYRYASNTNTEWMEPEEMRRLLMEDE
jgi:UDP-N-acetylglucosamine 4,6-dehydratase/5-epimerase